MALQPEVHVERLFGYGQVPLDEIREVSIMRNIHERSCFIRSLGPEFDDVTRMQANFRDAVYKRKDED